MLLYIQHNYIDTYSDSSANDTSVSIIGIRGIIGLGSIGFVLLSYCLFIFAVAIREVMKMKPRQKEEKKDMSDSDLSRGIDSQQFDETELNYFETDEQAQANCKVEDDLLLINKSTTENLVDIETEPAVKVRSVNIQNENQRTENEERTKSTKPVSSSKQQKKVYFGSKPQKKVHFVINLPK